MNVRRTSVLLVLCFLSLAPFAHAASDVVISQIYGGGGNSGATYKNDFIELFNRGTSTVSLAGWSVQYASSAGSTWQVTPLSGSIAPGQYYLVQEAAGTGGTVSLPAPNASGNIPMSATAGKVALVASTAALSGTCPAGVIDFVGFGSANCFEGSPTLATSNTTAAVRNNFGCNDSDNNGGNFAIAAPSPRNSASPLNVCAVPNIPPFIHQPSNPIATVPQGSDPVTVFIGGFDDNAIYNWSATAGAGITSVVIDGGQGFQTVSYTVTFNPAFSGTATFNARLSDGVNATVTQAVNIAVTSTVSNDPPVITAFANPVTTKAQDAAPFQLSFSGSDDNNIYNWSATPGTGISSAVVSAGQGTASATYTVTLQPGFSGTAAFTVNLSDTVNPNATAAVTITVTPAPPPPLDHITISQVYGGGGNSGATYRNDYVELYNPTTAAVDLAGWTIQYASATGTTWQAQPLGGIMHPGEYYLISLASGGAVGAFLPTPNIDGDINMSGTTGKVALSKTGDALSGCPVGDANLVDLVGYGTANCREGGTNASAPSNTTAIFRKNGGFTDTNVNGADFQTGAPSPRRTTPIQEIGPAVLSTDPRNTGTNAPRDASITVTFTETVDVADGWYTINCASTGNHDSATIASNQNAWIITPNANFLAGEQCTVTVFRQFVHDTDLDDSAPNTDTLASNVVFTFTVATGAAPAYPADVHLMFGNPTDAEADLLTPNDYLMVKAELALSYNRSRGTPNWVSWHLSDEWVGSLPRNDTFRPDPAIPADWYRVLHTDYFASGFDRGHMVPNADRDHQDSIPINQATFLMTNMLPQSPDNNQGPWADMENYLRTLLPANELYIVAGGAGTGGTGSSGFMTTFANGNVTVPAQTWKVVLVLPKAAGDDVARVTAGARTIAVIMPNVQGIRENDWMGYLTTVDAVEALTGYDFFENVPDAVENAIEAGINGANPPGVAGQTFTTNEDEARTVTLNAAGTGTLTYTIVSGPQHGTLSGTGANQTYTPAPDYFGADSFTFKVSNASGTSGTATVSITVHPVNDAPTAADDARSTNEDTALSFAAYLLTSNDTAGPANEASQSLVVSSVAPAANTNGTVSLAAGMITYTPAPNYNGPASFTYTVCDSGSLCATATVHVTVSAVNDAPIATVTAPATGVEGSAVSAAVAVSDLDAGDSSSIAWTVTKNGAPFASGTGASVSFTPDDNGAYAITATATDGSGATGSDTKTVNVSNAAPLVTAVSGPTTQQALGSATTITVVITDAGSADTHTATFAWGDNTTSTAVCAGNTCTASHTYAAAGVYSVSIVVSDDDGGIASAAFAGPVVYDNAGGSVTGGGWISTASGKTNFTVNTQYHKGAATPTGNTKFDLAGGAFNSTSFDWLVVTGTTAQFQGTGTIGGAGSYGFLATATDNGNSDTIRLKVWDKTTGATVYDSGTLAVNGGNVTIHNK
jgi:DNA/RNA endonuclease G (NUC1)